MELFHGEKGVYVRWRCSDFITGGIKVCICRSDCMFIGRSVLKGFSAAFEFSLSFERTYIDLCLWICVGGGVFCGDNFSIMFQAVCVCYVRHYYK